MAQSVGLLTSAQVMISVGEFKHRLRLCLTAQSLEPASDSVSPALSASPPLALCLSFSLSKKNPNIKKNFNKILRQWKGGLLKIEGGCR